MHVPTAASERFTAVALILAGLVHLLPGIGVLGTSQLARLYGVSLDDPNLILLMRHRALLFALLAGFMFAAVWTPALRPLALAAGLVSVSGFVLLYPTGGPLNPALVRVYWIDVGVLALLAIAIGLRYWMRRALRTF